MAAMLPAAVALAGWWKLRQLLYHIHWERGPTIVLLVVASIALVLAVPRLAAMVGPRERAVEAEVAAARRRTRGWVVAAALASAAAWSARDELAELRTNLASENASLLDIGGATWAAARRVFDYGQNPYTHVNQLQRLSEGPGVTETADGRVEIFGVPYYYGFAYFPATFLSYQPFRWIDPGQSSIRIGNAFWLAALIAVASWLAWRLAPADRRPQASALAALLLLVSTGLGGQLFFFGITDVVIPVYVLSALVAASYRSHLVAGCAMGLAFAAKLLPSALIALVFFAWLARRAGLRPALVGFVATSSIVLAPFVLWDPAGFLSATLLFYVAHHAGGDTTSLWYYLPQALRLPFQALGAVATLGVALWPLKSRSEDPRDLLRAMVVAALLFLASSPMIHLNYQFAVVPLACVALAADAMGPLAGRAQRRASSAIGT